MWTESASLVGARPEGMKGAVGLVALVLLGCALPAAVYSKKYGDHYVLSIAEFEVSNITAEITS